MKIGVDCVPKGITYPFGYNSRRGPVFWNRQYYQGSVVLLGINPITIILKKLEILSDYTSFHY